MVDIKRIDSLGNEHNVYYGIFYDSYDCMEYSVLQIQPKNSKFSCVVSKEV